jgi:hypothetical protein
MSADEKAAAAWDDYVSQQQEEKIEELERQLNAANAKIKRLVEAGDRMELYAAPHDSDKWNEAKEAKP